MLIHGWGRYPVVEAEIQQPATPSAAARAVTVPAAQAIIARGMGRSYGDSALGAHVLSTERLNLLHGFDAVSGILRCAAGVSLAEIAALFGPRGWHLQVTPGTQFVSVGGAIASDVHGKSHHLHGCFSSLVEGFALLQADGAIVQCSPNENAELFHATCGGMGLTGVILEATLRLTRVSSAMIDQTTFKSRSLEESLALFDEHRGATYSVAWIDCLARGPALGRSLLMLGEHAPDGALAPRSRTSRSVPLDMPGRLLNPYSIKAFNNLYYHQMRSHVSHRQVPMDSFFYPLDSLHHWNRLYGKNGFTQYQFVLPQAAGLAGMRAILARIAASGRGSFLTSLKALGAQNANLLSFPLEGYTLALDFKLEDGLFALLDELDAMVLDYGGRLYLAKDARTSAAAFRRGYPRWQEFQELRARVGALGKFVSTQSQRLGLD